MVSGISLDPAIREIDTEYGRLSSHGGAEVFSTGPVLGIDGTFTISQVAIAKFEGIGVDERDKTIGRRGIGRRVYSAKVDQGIEFFDRWCPPVAVAAVVIGIQLLKIRMSVSPGSPASIHCVSCWPKSSWSLASPRP